MQWGIAILTSVSEVVYIFLDCMCNMWQGCPSVVLQMTQDDDDDDDDDDDNNDDDDDDDDDDADDDDDDDDGDDNDDDDNDEDNIDDNYARLPCTHTHTHIRTYPKCTSPTDTHHTPT